MVKSTLIILLLWTLPYSVCGQSFTNGDLDGIVNLESLPTNWDGIPFTDAACQANSAIEATVDMLDETGPSLSGGIAGIPFAGNSFCSGLHASGGSNLWHEGIMQTVSGFTIGDTYEISFYQCVVKQTNCIDESGSWRIYLDNTLIGTSTPSSSTLASNDINLQWDNRTVSFVATATSHTIKFIPWDDDANINTSNSDNTGGLRMGIDKISFVTDPPPTVDLGPDTLLCIGDSLILNASFQGATYLWQDGSTDSVLTVMTSGQYWVNVTNSSGSVTDSIDVFFTQAPLISLGNDFTLCLDSSALLSVFSPNSSYLWQDGTTQQSYEVTQPGYYTVAVTNMCGTAYDSVFVSYQDCSTFLEMPNVFTPNGDGENDNFVPVHYKSIYTPQLTIVNRWGNTIFETSDLSTGWNGTSADSECSEGIYFWILEFTDDTGQEQSRQGFLHLIR